MFEEDMKKLHKHVKKLLEDCDWLYEHLVGIRFVTSIGKNNLNAIVHLFNDGTLDKLADYYNKSIEKSDFTETSDKRSFNYDGVEYFELIPKKGLER